MSMSSAADFPVPTSAPLGTEQESTANNPGSGGSMSESLASYDPATSSWRTCQRSLFGGLSEFSGTWPRSGVMRNGTVYPRPPSAPLTGEIGSSSWLTPSAEDHKPAGTNLPEAVQKAEAGLWPTPSASLGKHGGLVTPSKAREGGTLIEALSARTWPTPTVQDSANNGGPSQHLRNSLPLNAAVGGALNPPWVEWLMGFPIGWTALEPSETPSSPRSQK